MPRVSSTTKHTLIKGTFILTMTGFLTRFIGFFYRIFLSHSFGEEGVGLYQLIFPVYALCISFTAAGIQTAISRSVAQKSALHRLDEAKQVLFAGMGFSFILSCLTTCALQRYSTYLAAHVLGDERCTALLIAMSYALPFASLHSCISGYYYGLKQTGIPAASQLLEQAVRVVSVFAFCAFAIKKQQPFNISHAVFGLVLGEIASALFTLKAVAGQSSLLHVTFSRVLKYRTHLKPLIALSIPLTANRLLLNFLQSMEAISIPGKLLLYGCSTKEALSIYGVLTGMALPCILFPSAITSSVSIMLLPTVAEIQATRNKKEMATLIQKVSRCCFILGFASCLFFLLLGHPIGSFLFHSKLAGEFIVTLAWICPFLYANTTLISILNGLGKTTASLCINAAGLVLRIAGVWFLIPPFGVQGYLWGMLVSQIVITVSCIKQLKSFR